MRIIGKISEKILSIILAFVMVVSLFAGMEPLEAHAEELETTMIDTTSTDSDDQLLEEEEVVENDDLLLEEEEVAESDSEIMILSDESEEENISEKVLYSYNNAYDCKRNPAYPVKGQHVTLSEFKTPLGASSSSGEWKLIDCGNYDSNIHTEQKKDSIGNVVTSLAGVYNVQPSEIKVVALKKDGEHICYGVICTVFGDGVFFVGTTYKGGAGYYLSNLSLSASDSIDRVAVGNTGVLPEHRHDMKRFEATSATCTTDGNYEYYQCVAAVSCGLFFTDKDGNNPTTLETVTIPKLGHDLSGEWTVTKEATTTEEGKKEILCKNGCGEKIEEIIPIIALYTYNYAYDCMRTPAYPVKGEMVTLYDFDKPLGASSSSGKWELIDCGNYDSSKHTEQKEESIGNIVASLANVYKVKPSEIKVVALKKDGEHVCYGVICAVFDDGIFFVGTRYRGGAGYYLSNSSLSNSSRIEEEALNNESILPVHSHKMQKIEAISVTCTTDGRKAYYQCVAEVSCELLFEDEAGTIPTTLEAVTIPKLGHDWSGEWVVTKKPTTTEEGLKSTSCVNGCKETKEEIIPKIPIYSFNYAYDCKRSPSYPVAGQKVILYEFTTPIGADISSGRWELIDCGKYNSSIHTEQKEESIQKIVSNLATVYKVNPSEIDVVALQKDGEHVCYGVVCTVFNNGVFFIGTRYKDGAGYYLTNVLLSNSNSIVEDAKEDASGTTAHTHLLELVEAKEATCTKTGNTAYYQCVAGEDCGCLFKNADGTNQTTLNDVTIEKLQHNWSEEWVVTKEPTATEEGKKETLCTNQCGQKKIATIPVIGGTTDQGNLEKDAEVEPDTPIEEATLNNSKTELLGAQNIFDADEKQKINDGVDARVWIEISKTNEEAIAQEDKEKIDAIASEYEEITYFDVDLFKQVGNGEKKEITEPGVNIKITVKIPEELLISDQTVNRKYILLRLHDGEVDMIEGDFNPETGEFTFETDRFSTYAFVYEDQPVTVHKNHSKSEQKEEPKVERFFVQSNYTRSVVPATGDYHAPGYVFMLMLLSGLGILFCLNKKLKNKED